MNKGDLLGEFHNLEAKMISDGVNPWTLQQYKTVMLKLWGKTE